MLCACKVSVSKTGWGKVSVYDHSFMIYVAYMGKFCWEKLVNLVNLGNCKLITKIFPASIHRYSKTIFGIALTACSSFTKLFLAKSFYLCCSPKCPCQNCPMLVVVFRRAIIVTYVIACICDWIWENPPSTHTIRRYTFHHHTVAVHTS